MQFGSRTEESQVRGCYNVTLLQPARKEWRLSPEIKHVHSGSSSQQLSCFRRDTGEESVCWPRAQVLTTLPVRTVKLLPNQNRERKVKRSRVLKTDNALGYSSNTHMHMHACTHACMHAHMRTRMHACIYTHTQDLFSKLRLVDGHVVCLLGAVKVLIYESVLMNCVPV